MRKSEKFTGGSIIAVPGSLAVATVVTLFTAGVPAAVPAGLVTVAGMFFFWGKNALEKFKSLQTFSSTGSEGNANDSTLASQNNPFSVESSISKNEHRAISSLCYAFEENTQKYKELMELSEGIEKVIERKKAKEKKLKENINSCSFWKVAGDSAIEPLQNLIKGTAEKVMGIATSILEKRKSSEVNENEPAAPREVKKQKTSDKKNN